MQPEETDHVAAAGLGTVAGPVFKARGGARGFGAERADRQHRTDSLAHLMGLTEALLAEQRRTNELLAALTSRR
jgi:hypothetical protein